jgi:hypothetical protein
MTDLSLTPLAAFGSDRWCAERLGKSIGWFRTHRPRLEREGFPAKDTLIGLTLKADVDAFLARRRKVADAAPVHQDAHHATTAASEENLSAL